ncbi:hypothetical protein GCM10027089_61930 [Nocardia thraciensis]
MLYDTAARAEEILYALERLDLGEEWLRNVCYHNAARLFGIG